MKFVYICLFLPFLNQISLQPTQKYKYGDVLRLSLLFYEAQRSGKLSEGSRIPWRGNSALMDHGMNGEDLTGGYYDASDYVKFSFTMAFTTTLLAWGVASYKDAYNETDQYEVALDAIKWASDYFIKCHVSPNELYGQVGDFDLDHLFWGRPEEMNMSRPAYKIDADHPGSDLAGETAAALAATSFIFQEIDEEYAKLTLRHAEELYEFAVQHKGLYNDAIPGAKRYYESPDYTDDITWAAIWLYKSTNNSKYLEDADEFYKQYRLSERPNEFFYNKKVAGIQVLLASLTHREEFLKATRSFCDFSIHQQKRTPKRLVYLDKFGTLAHAANIAFICLQAADLEISPEEYTEFAREQIHYMLGDSGTSFVVGYGNKFILQAHHTASSCPDLPAPCNWTHYFSKEANPQILYGALVSGPDEHDYFVDRRDEYLYTEVSLDYNAGFQGALAGLLYRDMYSTKVKL